MVFGPSEFAVWVFVIFLAGQECAGVCSIRPYAWQSWQLVDSSPFRSLFECHIVRLPFSRRDIDALPTSSFRICLEAIAPFRLDVKSSNSIAASGGPEEGHAHREGGDEGCVWKENCSAYKPGKINMDSKTNQYVSKFLTPV